MDYTYSLTDKEASRYRSWKFNHRRKCIMPHYTICFTPSEVGTAVIIKCNCGKKKNITDYEVW